MMVTEVCYRPSPPPDPKGAQCGEGPGSCSDSDLYSRYYIAPRRGALRDQGSGYINPKPYTRKKRNARSETRVRASVIPFSALHTELFSPHPDRSMATFKLKLKL